MLARLVRFLLLVQVLTGAGLGWLMGSAAQATAPVVLLWAGGMAVLTPILITLGLTLLTCVLSRDSSQPGAPGDWWRSVASECRAVLRIFLWQEPWTTSAPVFQDALGQPGEPGESGAGAVPVLLVHGYICNHRLWDNMALHLRRAGHPVLAVDLEPVFTSIDNYVPLVDQAVRTLCQATGATRVALVGHSMGGLAIRAWMRAHGSQRVARVITLGTPHAGTRADPYPLTPNSQQMVLHSAWLQALAASETPATRRLMQVALSPQDNIVYPQHVQVLAGAPVTVFSGVGHVALVHDRRVRQWVLQQLEMP